MTIRFSAASILSVGFCWLAAGCGAAEDSTENETVSLELATLVAALEVNQNGDDLENADATEDAPMLMRSCGLAQIREKLVERFDANDDANLNEDELREVSEQFGGSVRQGRRRHITRQLRLRHLRSIYDADDSGDLDNDERDLLRADLLERCEARQAILLERFDADDSGSLDDEEWRDAHNAITERFAQNRRGILAAFDDNEDGRLGPIERHNAREAKRDEMSERRDAVRSQFDVDDSGDLDDAELNDLHDNLRERIRTPRAVRETEL